MSATADYVDICPHDECTGCMACLNSCHHSAIVLTEDSLGFKYPVIDSSACVGCGLCSKVCPALHPTPKVFPQQCFAFAVNSREELHEAASGGAASALSAFALAQGGIVYGCSGEDITHVRHVRIDSAEELGKLRGSKYVQSDVGTIFSSVRKDLVAGKQVLFIGTPCQVGGLKNFLIKDYDGLITADLVCHGVPSQKLLNDNIADYRRRYPALVESSIRFRYKKDFSKPSSAIRYGFVFRPSPEKEEIRKEWYDDPFMLGFLGVASLRTGCYSCPYAYSVRGADLTLSDFWGIGKDAGFNSGDGVSSILVNTDRGRSFWERFMVQATGCTVTERKIQESISNNMQLMCPTWKSRASDALRAVYPAKGLRDAVFTVLRKKRLKYRLKDLIATLKTII